MPIERKKGRAEPKDVKAKQDSFDEANPHLAQDAVSELIKERAELITEPFPIPITRKAKTMGNTDQNACRDNVKDVIIFGDDLFELMSKASSESEGWMKSTKGMLTGKGVVIQVTTQQRNKDGSYSVAEAVTYVPGVTLQTTTDDNNKIIGRKLKGLT